MSARARAALTALLAFGACHDFSAAYDDCVSRGACPANVSGSGGGAGETGTGGGGGAGGQGARLAVEPAAVELSSVPTERVTALLVVRNVGATPVRQVAIADPTEPHFLKRSTDCSGADLAPDASCTAPVDFLPTALGDVAGVVRVTSDAPTIEVPLAGHGVAPLSAAPSRLSFGRVNVGDVAPAQEVVFTNNSQLADAGVLRFTLTQAVLDAGSCVGRLPPRGTCSAWLAFAPTSPSDGGAVLVQGAAADGGRPEERALVVLDGEGYPPASLSFTPATLTLRTDFGTPAVEQVVVLRNTSSVEPTGTLGVGLLDDAGVFSLDAGTCVTAGLAPSATCRLSVGFNPSAPRTFAGQLYATIGDGGTRYAALSGTGYDFVPVRLTVEFPDSGSVVSDDGGINCPGTCSMLARRGAPMSFTARPAPNGVFGAFTGVSCASTTALSCVFTPTSDAGVNARATFGPARNTLTVTAGTEGKVTSSPAGLSCPGTCSFDFPYYATVTLYAAGKRGAALNAFSGACTGQSCSVLMDQARSVQVSWKVGHVNLAFLSTPWTTWASAGGRASADQQCADEAEDAGLPGSRATWRAVLATNGQFALDRYQTNTGWQRPDGEVVAQYIQQLRRGQQLRALTIDAWGRVAESFVVTGELPDAGRATCNDWTAFDAGVAYGALASWAGPQWLGDRRVDVGCTGVGQRSLYCLQDDPAAVTPTLQPPPPVVRLGFTSRGTRDGMTSDAEADSVCSSEAADAGLPGAATFSAVRTAQDAGTAWAFDALGPPFYRVDGVRLWDPALALVSGDPSYAPNVDARGQLIGDGVQWLGGCRNWTTNLASQSGSAREISSVSFRSTQGLSCDQQAHYLCLQR